MKWIERHFRTAKSLRKTVKLAAQAHGGYAGGLRLALAALRAEGLGGLRRGLALLVAQTELHPEAGAFAPDDYREWIRRYDTLSPRARQRQQRRALALPAPIPLSLVLLPGQGDERLLAQTLQSLQRQTYPHWELFIRADADGMHAAQDARIKPLPTGATNIDLASADLASAALEQASAAYVGFLHAGDELPEHALFCAAQALRRNPEAALLYADEDALDADGGRCRPWFKPDHNPELLLAQNLLTGLCLFQTRLARAAGGLRQGFGPWLAYDLGWRVLERSGHHGALHLPRVLCHRRQTAPAEPDCGQRAVQEHLDRTGAQGIATPAPGLPGMFRVVFQRPGPERTVSILIPTRDRADLLATCVHSILERTQHTGYEIVIIDNGSVEQATFELFASLPQNRVRIVPDGAPFNYSRLNNNGARAATGELLCLMNNDIEVIGGDWLGEMLSFALQPEIGCVGARLWYPDDTLQHGGILRGVQGFAGHAHLGLARGGTGYFGRAALHQNFSAVTAACLLVRRSIFDQVGGLDEALPESYNDVDFCLRVAAAGHRNVWTPYAELYHHESASRRNRTAAPAPGTSSQERQTTRLMRTRWGALTEDPAYNPNLTRLSCGFGLAWPPRTVPLDLL